MLRHAQLMGDGDFSVDLMPTAPCTLSVAGHPALCMEEADGRREPGSRLGPGPGQGGILSG